MTSVTASADGLQISECSPPPSTGATRPQRGYASGKEDYLRRLRKVEGQVRGLQKMIEADTWFPNVVIQVGSATRALQEVAVGLLNDHLRHCVLTAARGSPDGEAASLAEVAGAIRQVVRL
jgi:CsoR family transcriptional regulator, copper-sensing transcriptional repressor